MDPQTTLHFDPTTELHLSVVRARVSRSHQLELVRRVDECLGVVESANLVRESRHLEAASSDTASHVECAQLDGSAAVGARSLLLDLLQVATADLGTLARKVDAALKLARLNRGEVDELGVLAEVHQQVLIHTLARLVRIRGGIAARSDVRWTSSGTATARRGGRRRALIIESRITES